MFGDFVWLSAFSTDAYRLAAIAVAAVALVVIFTIGPVSRAWLADRQDARSHERRRLALIARLDDEQERRRVERLDRDA
jgi:hypothetical protein